MRKRVLLLSLSLFGVLACGRNVWAQKSTQSVPKRDVELERAISERYNKVMNLLPQEAKRKLAMASRVVLDEIVKRPEPTNLENIVHTEVNRRFSGLSPAQSDLLNFCALADVAQYAARRLDGGQKKANLETAADKTKNDLDSMSEMGEMESLRLQMAMDRQSKMMSTLSNILKKISGTADQIIQNIK